LRKELEESQRRVVAAKHGISSNKMILRNLNSKENTIRIRQKYSRVDMKYLKRYNINHNEMCSAVISHCKNSFADSNKLFSLRTIDELYDFLQQNAVKKSYFLNDMKNNKVSLSDFMNFACDRWIPNTNEEQGFITLKNKNTENNDSFINCFEM